VLDYAICGSSIESTIERFQQLSGRIFPQKTTYRCCTNFRRFLDWLKWWFNDSKYDSGELEDVVQEAFGTRKRLFDAHGLPSTGIKVGVMATTASNSELRIFTNYNGVNRHNQRQGKFFFHKDSGSVQWSQDIKLYVLPSTPRNHSCGRCKSARSIHITSC
jgi:hypothetical protein